MAATAIRIDPRAGSSPLLQRLGADAGGPLVIRAQRGQPLAHTELDAAVRRELQVALVGSEDVSQESLPAGCP